MDALRHSHSSNSYVFTGLTGDRVWIRAADSNSSIDASLQLTIGDSILATVKGHGGDVQIFDYMLPNDTTYKLTIFDNNRNDHGAYGLSLHQLDRPKYAPIIECGDDIQTNLEHTVSVASWRIAVDSGDVALAQIRADNPSLEARFIIMTSDGNIIKKSIRKSNSHSKIDPVFIDNDDTLTILAYDKNGNDTGTIGFTYQDLNDPSCGAISYDCRVDISSTITKTAEVHGYTTYLKKGQGLLGMLVAEDPNFEAKLECFGPDGRPVREKISRIKAAEMLIPQIDSSGFYTVFISDNGANDKSSYNLSIRTLASDCAIPLSLCSKTNYNLSRLTEIHLFHFNNPFNADPIFIQEIDPELEFLVSVINQGNYQKYRANNKLQIPLNYEPGTGVFVAVTDYAANDTGRYTFMPSPTLNFEGDMPVAVLKNNRNFQIPPSGNLQLLPKDLDDGSYDNCTIESMIVEPNYFTCEDLGEHEVLFSLTDNEGNKIDTTVVINIISDLQLETEKCKQISVSSFLLDSCTSLRANATGGSGNYFFQWSHGEEGMNTTVCPSNVQGLQCVVVDTNGCRDSAFIYIPTGDNIKCSENSQEKIKICNTNPNEPNPTKNLCVTSNDLVNYNTSFHLMGECDVQCNKVSAGRNHESTPHSRSGVVLEYKKSGIIEIAKYFPNAGKVEYRIINLLGQILQSGIINSQDQPLINLSEIPNGHLLYLQIMDLSSEDTSIQSMPIFIH